MLILKWFWKEYKWMCPYLDEHLGSGSHLGLLGGNAVTAHRFAVTWELECEVLLPHRLQVWIKYMYKEWYAWVRNRQIILNVFPLIHRYNKMLTERLPTAMYKSVPILVEHNFIQDPYSLFISNLNISLQMVDVGIEEWFLLMT